MTTAYNAELVKSENLPESIADEIAASSNAIRARNRLAEFLDDAYASLPAVDEEEAVQDIQEAIRAVRTGT